MIQSMLEAVRTFVSYSHDSPDHEAHVLELATRMRDGGIDVEIDAWVDSPPEGWPQWMERHIREARFVLVVCTAIYNQRSRGEERPGRGRGVRWESLLAYQHIYDADGLNERFIPVVFRSEDHLHIPTPLRGATYYNVNEDGGYQNLYRRLTGQRRRVKPPLGAVKMMPPEASAASLTVPLAPTSTPTAAPPAAALPVAISEGYTLASLRAFIMDVLVADSDLDALCIDYFPDTNRYLSSGMDRVAKVNQLLQREDARTILKALQESQPSRYKRFLLQLKHTEAGR